VTLHAWLAFTVIAVAVSIVPGPAVIAVISGALRSGFRASLATNAGAVTPSPSTPARRGARFGSV
jgi:threonine/homoserine/homoserine lactone efflux protein